VVNKINRLSARAVAAIAKPGRHADGGNLYLRIDKGGAKSWVFFYRLNGRQREAGLGGINSISLSKAREKAAKFRELLVDGRDPIDARQAARTERDGRKTFGVVAYAFLEAKTEGLRNAKHKGQWRRTLETYALPIWHKPIDTIDTAAILEILKPVWQSKPEQASRVRARIENVLDAARVQGLRSGDNPARWKGNLDKLLPSAKKLSKGHHAAMPYRAVPAFVTRLREGEAVSALALEFLILTAARTGEVLHAQWPKIDLASSVWTVPASRMKAKREHRVPLSPRATAIVKRMAEVRAGPFVFSGQRLDKPLSNMALEMTLRRMKAEGVTVHGFRSSFRDWAGEETHFPREVCEAALAHAVGNSAEQAYRRADALEKRRKLMNAWAQYLTQTTATVASIECRASRGHDGTA
jgi:integrase